MLFWKSHFDFETSNFICLSGNTLHFLVKLVREDKPTVHFCTFYKKAWVSLSFRKCDYLFIELCVETGKKRISSYSDLLLLDKQVKQINFLSICRQ